MGKFTAIGYHGSKDELSKETIDFYYMQYNDHFLGRGFYIFRDSYSRAEKWVENRHEEGSFRNIYKVKINVDFDRMLNFSSTSWGNELDIFELFLEICKRYQIHFGIFLDILIDDFGVEVDAIAMIDLRDEGYFVPVVSEHKTLFAFGDIQICIKAKDIIEEFQNAD